MARKSSRYNFEEGKGLSAKFKTPSPVSTLIDEDDEQIGFIDLDQVTPLSQRSKASPYFDKFMLGQTFYVTRPLNEIKDNKRRPKTPAEAEKKWATKNKRWRSTYGLVPTPNGKESAYIFFLDDDYRD